MVKKKEMIFFFLLKNILLFYLVKKYKIWKRDLTVQLTDFLGKMQIKTKSNLED